MGKPASRLKAVGKDHAHGVDMWELEGDSSYSVDKFYIRSTNSFDHAAKLQLPLPREQLFLISELVEAFPEYRSNADAVRDAIVHLCHYRGEQIKSPDFHRTLSMQRRLAVLDMQEAEIDNSVAAIARIKALLERAANEGDADAVLAILDSQEETANEMREPYRSRLMALLSEFRSKSASA